MSASYKSQGRSVLALVAFVVVAGIAALIIWQSTRSPDAGLSATPSVGVESIAPSTADRPSPAPESLSPVVQPEFAATDAAHEFVAVLEDGDVELLQSMVEGAPVSDAAWALMHDYPPILETPTDPAVIVSDEYPIEVRVGELMLSLESPDADWKVDVDRSPRFITEVVPAASGTGHITATWHQVESLRQTPSCTEEGQSGGATISLLGVVDLSNGTSQAIFRQDNAADIGCIDADWPGDTTLTLIHGVPESDSVTLDAARRDETRAANSDSTWLYYVPLPDDLTTADGPFHLTVDMRDQVANNQQLLEVHEEAVTFSAP